MGNLRPKGEWLKYGMQMGYCSRTYCTTHDQIPLTMAEDEEFLDDGDPCVHGVRLYEEGEPRE